MYGTMHVSEKKYRITCLMLFEKLMSVDYIANESEPNTWSKLYDLFSFYQGCINTVHFIQDFIRSHLKR